MVVVGTREGTNKEEDTAAATKLAIFLIQVATCVDKWISRSELFITNASRNFHSLCAFGSCSRLGHRLRKTILLECSVYD